MERHDYIECGRNLIGKIRKEVNGLVRYEVYPEADLIIIKIIFKEFDFNYAVKDIQDLMYMNGLDGAVDDLLKKYKKSILSGFFKTNERKSRDERVALGISE